MFIDIHMHTGGEAVGFHMTNDMIIELMEKYRVDYGMVSNGDAGECDHNQKVLPDKFQKSQEKALQDNIDFAREYPDKICLAVWVKPKLQGMTDELYTLMEENLDIIKAIKLHPYHSDTAPTDSSVIPYLEFAKKHNLAVISHTGGCEKASPTNLYKAAKLFPSVPFIMAHMGLGSDNSEALDLLGKADNLFGDTAWVPLETTLKAIKHYGSKKIMFGSDAPIDGVDTYLCNPKGERSIYQDYFEKLKNMAGDNAYDDIMYKNAINILNLNVPKE